jgi:hypothetical protein
MTPFGLPFDSAIIFGVILLAFMLWYANRPDEARRDRAASRDGREHEP